MNPNFTKEERKAQGARDNELDEFKAIKETLDRKDAELKNVAEIDVTNKALFLKWTVSRMEKEAIKKAEPLWLESVTYFSVKNDQDCYIDFPITPKAFILQSLDKLIDVPLGNQATNKKPFNYMCSNQSLNIGLGVWRSFMVLKSESLLMQRVSQM